MKARQSEMTDLEVFEAAQKSAFVDNSVVKSYRDQGLDDHDIRIKMVTECGMEIDPLSYVEEMIIAIATQESRRFDFAAGTLTNFSYEQTLEQ